MNECGFCKDRSDRLKNYEEEIEREKNVQCEMALEREKIAKGMQCTKLDEVKLKQMQKMQMEEKRMQKEQAQEMERIWHEVLLNTVKMKEDYERHEEERLKQEMIERRLLYNEQIASANRKRREAINHDREIENRRLERMKKKMEQDYYEAINRKKDQQMKNRANFIEGHNMKLTRIRTENKQERELDQKIINVAMEELRKEKERMKNQMKSLRLEEKVFVDQYYRERTIADQLERETENAIVEWEQRGRQEAEEKLKSAEIKRLENKKSAAQEYRRHIEQRKHEIEEERRERYRKMERVKDVAYAELKRNLQSANEEMRRQNQYRNTLTNQIKENQEILEAELNSIETKQRPFTKKAIMFKEAMADKVNNSRVSTNPVHPFRRKLETQFAANISQVTLPSIDKFNV